MAKTTPTEDPLFKLIVPARRAAQKAAANLKEQHTRRPRTSAPQVEIVINDDAHLAKNKDKNINPNPPSERSQRDTRASPGRRRDRGRAGTNREIRAPVRRQSSKNPKRSSPRYSDALSSSDPEIPRPPTFSTPSKRAKVAPSPPSNKPSSSFTSSPMGLQDKHSVFHTQGDLVWVRVNTQGKSFDPEEDAESMSYWWPAQVTSGQVLQVDAKLFGDDDHGADSIVNIPSPSPSTILSFRHEGRLRFSTTDLTFVNMPSKANPSKTQPTTEAVPTDIALRWKTALDSALARHDLEELPDPLEVLNMTLSAKKRKRKRNGAREPEPEPLALSPSRLRKSLVVPLDQDIKVGTEDGELVLARDHKDRPDHWPARVIGVSQNKKTGNWLYEVCFMDGKKKKMDRKNFFSADEEGFAVCQLGMWRTELADSDTEGVDSEDEIRNHGTSRSFTPSPSVSDLEDISDCEKFCDLPLREQMRYVYPFLCRTIRREYQPSLERHDAFMKGGKIRQQLAQAASLRGDFSENEVKKVSTLVRRVMLRNERWAKRVHDGDDVGNEESHITRGSAGTNPESVDEKAAAHSSDFDMVMTLTELKSSQEYSLLATPLTPAIAPEVGFSIKGMASSSPHRLNHGIQIHPEGRLLVANSSTTEIAADSRKPPPKSIDFTSALDHSSDMEMSSCEDDQPTEIEPARLDALKKYEEVSQVTRDEGSWSSTPPAHTSSAVQLDSPQTWQVPQGHEGSHMVAAATSRARPIGCAEYENLPRSERGLYCTDVLLPEAVLQLHLLRAGLRSSAHVLTPEKETKLHEEGQELLQTEVHWLTQIVQLRQLAEKLQKSGKKKEKLTTIIQGGTSTRPKMLISTT